MIWNWMKWDEIYATLENEWSQNKKRKINLLEVIDGQKWNNQRKNKLRGWLVDGLGFWLSWLDDNNWRNYGDNKLIEK